MKKIIILFFLLLSLGFISVSNPIKIEYARTIALNYHKIYHLQRTYNDSVLNEFEIKYNGVTTMFVFNFKAGGFAIISADDAATPILAESDKSEIKQTIDIPELKIWIESYNKQISDIKKKNLSNKETITKWKKYEIITNNKSGARDITPFCLTTWDQGYPYNDSCPIAAGGPCGRVWAGCIATAMGQIMKYYNYPPQGLGSHSYTSSYGVLQANFGSTNYLWDSMPNNISVHNNAIAQLLYHIGISVDMIYGTNGSGSSSYSVPSSFINYFNYQPSAQILSKGDYTDAQWTTILRNELDDSRPIYYSGYDQSMSEGHAFVFDGYQIAQNNYHVNWGWSGSSDGYYIMGSLNPGYDFSYGNCAVIRIRPKCNAPIASFTASNNTPAIGSNTDFYDLSTNNPTSWTWTFEGGSPSTSNLQNPTGITFSSNGKKLISLKVSNSSGSDIKYFVLDVGGIPSAWILQNTGFINASRGIDQIAIVNPLTVWAKAYDGTNSTNYLLEFTKTVDGGSTWKAGAITFTGSANYGCSNLYPFSDTVCYAAVFPKSGNGGIVFKTTDGGNNWNPQPTADFSSSWLNWVTFFNQNEGVCMGDPNSSSQFIIYTTTDGGVNWNQVPYSNIPNALSGETGVVNYYDKYENTIWFGTSKGNVFKSTDKGLNWTSSSTGFGDFTNIKFKNNNIGIAELLSTNSYQIKKTTDGGTTWNAINPSGAFVKMFLTNIPGTTGMWVNVSPSSSGGCHIGSSYSLDDCNSFFNIDTGSVQYTSVAFYDSLNGWAGGFNTNSTIGGIYKWNPKFITTGIASINNDNLNINIYPNPSNGKYNILFGSEINENPNIEVLDILGKSVYKSNINLSNNKNYILNLENKSGLYIVQITFKNSTLIRKISLIK